MGKSILRRSKPLIVLLLSTLFITFIYSDSGLKICKIEVSFKKNPEKNFVNFRLAGKKITLPGYLYKNRVFCGVGWFQNIISKGEGYFSTENIILNPVGVDKRRGIYIFNTGKNKIKVLKNFKGYPLHSMIFSGDKIKLIPGMSINNNLFCLFFKENIPPFILPVLDNDGNVAFFIQKKFRNLKNCMGITCEKIDKNRIISIVKKIAKTSKNIPMPYFGMFISNSKNGVIVKNILPNFSAYRYGIRKGDIIFFVDNFSIHFVEDFLDILKKLNPDKFHTFTIQRGDKILKIKIKPDKK